MNLRPALFFDRDGTLNVEVETVAAPEDLIVLPGVGEAVRIANDAGWPAILVTNQAVIARGQCDADVLRSIHKKLRAELAASGAHLDAIYFCPHHPDFEPACTCRKPKPGMLLAAVRDFDLDLARSWVVGDSAKDIQLARNAGARAALVRTGKAGRDIGTDGMDAQPDCVFDTLVGAVAYIARKAHF